ncbi:MAG: MBL fold metallo-hydrolase [Oscillospiraceae bacterium]|nr:MBL fold metallo-hydrolase [Oscillospiraceae bacterium]
MELKTLCLGSLGTNCYLLDCGGSDVLAVDIGDGAQEVLDVLSSGGRRLLAILLTHGHYDHVAGVEEVRRATGARVYIHEADAVMLTSARANLAWQISDTPYIPVEDFETVQDGQVLTVGTRSIRVMHTPGHTPGGCCFFTEDLMFSGDTLFKGSIGRTDLGGNVAQMQETLRMLSGIPGEYRVYPGHFGSSTLTWERQHNPYLRQR